MNKFCLYSKNALLIIFISTILFSDTIYAQYCTATVVGTSPNVGIVNLTVSNVNYNSLPMEGYKNYTAQIATVYRVTTYSVSVSAGGASQQDLAGWVDWNQDGDFADAGEKVLGPTKFNNVAPHVENVTIPSTALTGYTRMRIVSDRNGNPHDSCTTTQASGDIEDYTLEIRDTVVTTSTQYLSPQFVSPATEKKVLGIEVFSSTNFSITSFAFNTNGTSNLGAISNAKVFYSGGNYSFANTQFGVAIPAPAGAFNIAGNLVLQPGTNYFWLTYDVNGSPGDVIDAQLTGITVNSINYTPQVNSPALSLTIKGGVCNINPKRNNIWYFGNNAGLNFNGGAPVAITNGAITNHQEGTACVSDKNGAILFYTDGITVWNKNHVPMPNGNNLYGDNSTSQVLILEQPDNDSIYYIFTLDAWGGVGVWGTMWGVIYPKGLRYSVVDMSKSAGLGDVIVKNTLLLAPAAEKIVAVMNSNNKDVWILCHDWPGNKYYAYRLTDTDLEDPVVNTIGAFHNPALNTSIGVMKVSPNSNKVAAAIPGLGFSGTNFVELMDFNSSTGMLSNLITLNFALATNPYGIAFSPNSNLLYVSENVTGVLCQFNISLGTQALIAASKVALSANSMQGQMQLAPDGKIYTSSGQPSLGRINNPNVAGVGCGFANNSFNLAGKTCRIGLPNTFIPPPMPIASVLSNATICPGNSATLLASGGGTYSWSTGATTTSIIVTPTVTTTYSVIAANGACTDTASATVTLGLNALISGATSICVGGSGTLTASGGSTYSWNTGATSASIIVTPTATANYSVIVTNGGCQDTAYCTVTVNPVTAAITGIDTICAGDLALLNGSGGGSYSWNTGQNSSSISVSPSSTTTYTLIVSIGTCTDTATFMVNVQPGPTANAGINVTINTGGSTTLTAAGGGTYSWSNGATDSIIIVSPAATTVYCVTVTDANGCKNTACVTVVVDMQCGEVFIPKAFSPNNDGHNDVFYIRGNCFTAYRCRIYDRWGEKVFETYDQSKGWNGRFNEKELDPAVFVYSFQGTLLSGETISRKGNVSLMR